MPRQKKNILPILRGKMAKHLWMLFKKASSADVGTCVKYDNGFFESIKKINNNLYIYIYFYFSKKNLHLFLEK